MFLLEKVCTRLILVTQLQMESRVTSILPENDINANKEVILSAGTFDIPQLL
jgi:hypothetical protein